MYFEPKEIMSQTSQTNNNHLFLLQKTKNINTICCNLKSHYTLENPTSLSLFKKAIVSLPGGNTRSALFFAPFPLYVKSANGCTITSADGRTYIDFLGEYSAGLYGHTHPKLQAEIIHTVQNGLSFGGHHAAESELAELVCNRFPSIDSVRFTNSGTEATMMALATAKMWTQRSKIVVFKGGYHGAGFVFSQGTHASNVPHEFLVLEYNNENDVRNTFEEYVEEIAAVLIEPMLGAGGGILATHEFLKLLRHITTQYGTLLIFDEVMTSRLYNGSGLQGYHNIKPDLTTLGKYIGGGMSFGAFGGRRDIMALYDPRGNSTGSVMPHSGTFNNNVLTMRVGACGLRDIFTKEVASTLQKTGDKLRYHLNKKTAGTTLKALGCGSIVVFHFTKVPLDKIRQPADCLGEDPKLMDMLHLELLEAGFYMARRGYISLNLAMGDHEVYDLVYAVQDFTDKYKIYIQE